MKTLTTILFFALAISAGIAGYIYGSTIEYASQLGLYEGLRNTSAIIFGVMGAWIAIVYPRAFESLQKGAGAASTNGGESHLERVRNLLYPLVISTFILAVLLIALPVLEVIKSNNVSGTLNAKQRSISFCILCILTVMQLLTILYTLVQLLIAESDIDIAKQTQDTKHTITKHQMRR